MKKELLSSWCSSGNYCFRLHAFSEQGFGTQGGDFVSIELRVGYYGGRDSQAPVFMYFCNRKGYWEIRIEAEVADFFKVPPLGVNTSSITRAIDRAGKQGHKQRAR